MANVPSKELFQQLYTGRAPWDIGKPQPAFVERASKITGSILDAGCGTGEHALFFAARGQPATGIDYLEEPIKRALQKAEERKLKVSFFVMNALALKDLKQQFDSAIDSGLFHVLADEEQPKYVAGLSSVIKPVGRVFLMCFSDEEPGTEGPRRVSKQELHDAFAKGWTVESIDASRFEVIPDLKDMTFSPGGPKAWFAIIRRDE